MAASRCIPTCSRSNRGWALSRHLPLLARISVRDLRGVGVRKADALAELDIHTVLDLITHYPRRYIDCTNQASIRDLKIGEEGMILGTVRRSSARRARSGRMLVDVELRDATGSLHCTFF